MILLQPMAEACPDENQLLDLVSGGQVSPEVARHVAECPTCSRLLADAFGTPEAPALEAGAMLGRYQIIKEIGRGGVGVVYEGRDESLGRTVAIKVLRRASPEAQMRMMLEARTIARLDHPNVVSIFDAGQDRDTLYFAMALVRGRSVRELMSDGARPRELLRALIDAGRGLAAAHRAGIVHRDFKPANVLVGDDGRVVVVDFGLAAIGLEVGGAQTVDGPLETRLTITGQLLGTPGYMSPEQLAGRPTDARSDQFSFCASVVHALTGSLPFRGTTIATLRDAIEHARFDETALAKLPRDVRRVVQRGLAADPAKRYPSMDALLTALEGRRRRVLVGAALGVGGLAAIATIGYLALRSDAPTDPCVIAASRIDEVWNAHRDLAGFDTWVAHWRSDRETACRKAKPGVDPAIDRAALCLDGLLVDLGATIDALGSADVAPMARHALAGLPPSSRCLAPKPPVVSTDPRATRAERVRERLRWLGALAKRGGTTLTVLTGTPETGNRLYRLALPDSTVTPLGTIAHTGDLWELRASAAQAFTFDRQRDLLLVIDRGTGAIARSVQVAGDIHHNGRGLALSPTGDLIGLFRGRELARIDTATGAITSLATLDASYQLETMTYCPNGTLFAAGTTAPGNATGRTLLAIDAAHGSVTSLGAIGETAIDIDVSACALDGSALYGVDTTNAETNDLYAIDPSTGRRTFVAAIPGPVNGLVVER